MQCVGDAEKFLEKPPPGIDLLRELSVVSDETVSILFTIPGVLELLSDCELTGCLLDWTYIRQTGMVCCWAALGR